MAYKITFITLVFFVSSSFAQKNNNDCLSAINDVSLQYMQSLDQEKTKTYIDNSNYSKKLKSYLKNQFLVYFNNPRFTLNSLYEDEERFVRECKANI